VFELNKLKLINPEQESQLKENFSRVFLHSSINNRKVIGNMNNYIKILDYHKYMFEDMQDYFYTETFNDIPLKQTDYFCAKDVIKEKINQLFKGNLKIT
jgi:hypothetical protein